MPADPQRLEEAAQLARQGRYDEALLLFNRLQDETPDDADLQFLIGACQFKRGQNELARNHWERALQIDPLHSKTQSMLAKLPDPGRPPTAPPTAKIAPKKKPAGKKASGGGWIKKLAFLAVLALVGFFAIDMYTYPQTYSFLSAYISQPDPEQTADTPVSGPLEQAPPPKPAGPPLETALAGRYAFKFEGNPALLTFQPNGVLVVEIDRGGGVKLRMDGNYQISGDTITVNVSVPTPEGIPTEEQVTLYNAVIENTDLTFNYGAPDGPPTRAYKQ